MPQYGPFLLPLSSVDLDHLSSCKQRDVLVKFPAIGVYCEANMGMGHLLSGFKEALSVTGMVLRALIVMQKIE